MKPFFLTSILLHGVLLFLLFSWGIPLADKFSPKNIIEVSLVPGEVEKPKEKPIRTGKEKKIVRRAEREEIAATLTKEEPPNKEEGPLKDPERTDLPQETLRPKEEEVSPPKPELAGGGQKKAPDRDEHLLFPSMQPSTGKLSGTGGPDSPGASFVAALRTGNEEGGNRVGIKGLEPGVGQGKGHPQTGKVHGNSQGADETLLMILRKIEAAKKYPRKAQKMGIEGKALVRFKMRPNGSVETVELLESSGSEILDRASLETVRDAAPLPYKEGWLKVGIVFKIL